MSMDKFEDYFGLNYDENTKISRFNKGDEFLLLFENETKYRIVVIKRYPCNSKCCDRDGSFYEIDFDKEYEGKFYDDLLYLPSEILYIVNIRPELVEILSSLSEEESNLIKSKISIS